MKVILTTTFSKFNKYGLPKELRVLVETGLTYSLPKEDWRNSKFLQKQSDN